MALEFKLPDIGEGIAEGEIVNWLVSEGEDVVEHQPVVEVMTDKATVEIPAPRGGRLTKQLAAAGDVVPVGTVIFTLDTAAAGADGAPASATPAPVAAPAAAAPAPAPVAAAPVAAGGPVLEFKLPDIGEGIAEGEIVSWLVAEGDTVVEHQPVVEVMTDKATVEIPSPRPGRVTRLLAQAGEVVPVGSVIFHLEGAGVAAAAPAAAASTPAAAAPSAPAAAAAPAPVATNGATNGKVLAVPSARRVARELGIDLGQVQGTGRSGVIRRADVEAFSTQPQAAPAAAPARSLPQVAPVALATGPAETRVPFRGVRRKIAEAMVRSKFTAPHFTVVEELDVTDLVKVRAQGKLLAAAEGVKLTYMPFIMKAVASGLVKFPELNSKLDEAAQEIVTYHRVNLGIAMDTDNGLIVPVIQDVQAKGLMQLGRELGELADRTRAGKMTSDDLRGSTFSITNAGNIGGTLATPIINFPDAGILGVHRIVKRPGVVETPEGDRIEVRQFMNLSISVDHRIVDGASAARFLTYMRQLLENPGLLAL